MGTETADTAPPAVARGWYSDEKRTMGWRIFGEIIALFSLMLTVGALVGLLVSG